MEVEDQILDSSPFERTDFSVPSTSTLLQKDMSDWLTWEGESTIQSSATYVVNLFKFWLAFSSLLEVSLARRL